MTSEEAVNSTPINGRRAWRMPTGLLLFVAVACLNVASMSREVPWGDARPVYEVAESLVAGQGVWVKTRWPPDASPGRGGHFYAAQPFLPSLLHVPGAALHTLLGHLGPSPEIARVLDAFACHLAGSLVGAFVVWLFYLLCLRHGASQSIALFAAALLAVGSIVWVYARSPFTEIVQIACFTGFFLELSKLLGRLDDRTALLVGLWAGMLVNTKYIYGLSLPGAFLVVLLVHWREIRPLARACVFAALGLVPGALMALAYNFVRFGSVFNTGYKGVTGVLVENVLVSLWGFFFSPGKSLFLYTPPLLLALLGFGCFWRAHRATALAILLTVFPVLLFYARFPSWPGDWAWGPRYAVFAVPVLLLPAVSFLSSMRWPRRSLAVGVLAIGIFVQVLGNAFYWDHYLRIALDVRTKWLGQPNRTASLTTDKGGFCEGCFEDVYPTVWLGPFQPILGHLWLLRHVPSGDNWQKASQDAPWRRHTRLVIDGRGTYDRARLDHWLCETTNRRKFAWVVVFGLLGASAAAGVLAVKRARQQQA